MTAAASVTDASVPYQSAGGRGKGGRGAAGQKRKQPEGEAQAGDTTEGAGSGGRGGRGGRGRSADRAPKDKPYTRFVLYKENKDSHVALGVIGEKTAPAVCIVQFCVMSSIEVTHKISDATAHTHLPGKLQRSSCACLRMRSDTLAARTSAA